MPVSNHASVFVCFSILAKFFIVTVTDYCLVYDPCNNGATCTNDAVQNFTCACSEEWVGDRCDEGTSVKEILQSYRIVFQTIDSPMIYCCD